MQRGRIRRRVPGSNGDMMKRMVSRAVVAIVVIAVVNLVYDRLMTYRAASHLRIRTDAIVTRARAGGASIILLGDSIVEAAPVRRLCGKDVLNAGLAGAPISGVRDVARRILPGRRAEFIVIAAGVNDTAKDNPTESATFALGYREVIALARTTGAKVVALNIEPVAVDNAIFDPDRMIRAN